MIASELWIEIECQIINCYFSYPSVDGTLGVGCSRICPSGKFPSGYRSAMGIDGGFVCWREGVEDGWVPFVTTGAVVPAAAEIF